MPRPSKPISLKSGEMSKKDKHQRLKKEKLLKGNSDKITPPSYLNKKQKDLFNNIVNQLRASEILSNLDSFILTTFSIAVDRLREIETMINKNFNLLQDRQLMSAKEKYSKDLFRCVNELSLSPTSRAKISTLNTQAKADKIDPLLKILNGGKMED